MASKKDITGQRFGKLIAISSITKKHPKRKYTYWLCKCDCGKECEIVVHSLCARHTTSCGCIAHNRSVDPTDSSWYQLIYSYKKGARLRKIEFCLTDSDVKNICLQNCFYCGVKPLQIKSRYLDTRGNIKKGYNNRDQEYMKRSALMYNGIDRVNNDLGYTKTNCVACCSVCNEMKMDRTKDEWFAQMRRILQFSDQKETI